MTKKLFIKTWGCQMNVYDSDRMADVVAPLGYAAVSEPDDADLVIFNTCHIREKATDKLFSELGRLRLLQKARSAAGGRMMVAVAGCVAQAEGAEIQRRAPYVDMVVGPQAYHQLPEMIAKLTRGAGGQLNTDFPVDSKFDYLPQPASNGKVSAFLSIQEGCDKFCTFCVVPYTRGAEYSRGAVALLNEATALIRGGAVEITVLGQNVNAFHGEGEDGFTWNLAKLLRALAEIPGVQRLRYTTSHPRDMGDDLIAAHGAIPQLMPLLHLPVQSGSDAILSRMNRKHTADDYSRIIDRLRQARPDMAFSSDFIIGFPGESDADFQDTLRLVRDVGFAQSFSFKYSRRPGTPAAAMEDQVEAAVADARLQELQALLRGQQLAFNQATVGQVTPVLVENASSLAGHWFGRSPFMQAVRVAGDRIKPGDVVKVKIDSAGLNSLSGQAVVD